MRFRAIDEDAASDSASDSVVVESEDDTWSDCSWGSGCADGDAGGGGVDSDSVDSGLFHESSDEEDLDLPDPVVPDAVVVVDPVVPDAAAFRQFSDTSYAVASFQVEGLGELRLYEGKRKYIDAVCSRHGAKCKVSRTCLGLAREVASAVTNGRGRPIGLLVYWLRLQTAPGVESRAQHVHDVVLSSYQARLDARAYFSNLPGSAEFSALCERPLRAGESIEPFEIA